MTDWFQSLTGFQEVEYEATRARLEVAEGRLRSRANGRSFGIGTLEVVPLADLRHRARQVADRIPGRLQLSEIRGDIRAMHADPRNARAMFQVASQFNLLEMTGPNVSPEDGVTRYESDATQGPACAIAAGAATIYRNYFAPVDGGVGQTRERQIDWLR